MGDLKSVKLMYLKGLLFLVGLLVSSGLILFEHFSWKLVFLLSVTIWSSARLYYFMFYVIERYADPSFKFAGVFSFLRYLVRRRREPKT